MDRFCENHPYSEAHWFCKKCQTSYCFSCIDKKQIKFSKNDTFVHICPACKRMVEWIGIHHVSDNFIMTILKSLLYPLSPFALIVILVMACFGMLFSKNLYLNEVLFALIWTVNLSYAVNVLSHSLDGQNKTPAFTSIPLPALVNHITMVFRHILILLFMAIVIIGCVEMGKKSMAHMFIIVFSFILPYILMKNTTSSKLRSYFDLLSFLRIIKKTVFLYLTASLLSSSIIAVFYLYSILQPGLVTFIAGYSMVALYRLISQIILKCHKDLNFSINYEHFKDKYTLETLHGFKA